MNKFLKTVGVYFLGSVASKIIVFFLLPLYSKMIPDYEYGYYNLINSVMGVIIPVICLEIWTGILRFVFDYKEKDDKQKVVSCGVIVSFVAILIYIAGFLLAGRFFDIQYPIYVCLFGMFSLLNSLYGFSVRALEKNNVFVVSGIMGTVVNVTSNLILILKFGMTIEAIFISLILSYLIPIIFMEIKVGIVRKIKISHFDKTLIKSLLRFCLPLSVNSVAYWFLANFSQVVIYDKLGSSMSGQYGFAGKFTSLIALAVSIFTMAWQELSYSKGNDENRVDYYSKFLKYYARFIGGAILFLIPFTSVIYKFFIADAYQMSKTIIPIYYLSTYASTVSTFLGSIYCAEKNTKDLFFSNAIGAVISVSTLFVLIKYLGVHSAPISLFISFGVCVAIRLVQLKKTLDVKVDIKFFAVFFIMFLATTFIYYSDNIWFNTAWLLVCVAFIIFIMRELIATILKSLSTIKERLLNK